VRGADLHPLRLHLRPAGTRTRTAGTADNRIIGWPAVSDSGCSVGESFGDSAFAFVGVSPRLSETVGHPIYRPCSICLRDLRVGDRGSSEPDPRRGGGRTEHIPVEDGPTRRTPGSRLRERLWCAVWGPIRLCFVGSSCPWQTERACSERTCSGRAAGRHPRRHGRRQRRRSARPPADWPPDTFYSTDWTGVGAK
jgi:hypothetical protein